MARTVGIGIQNFEKIIMGKCFYVDKIPVFSDLILNYLDKKRFLTYWANTSSNSLVGKLIREGNPAIKETTEELLGGGRICAEIEEQDLSDTVKAALEQIEGMDYQVVLIAEGIGKERIRKFAFEGKRVLIG